MVWVRVNLALGRQSCHLPRHREAQQPKVSGPERDSFGACPLYLEHVKRAACLTFSQECALCQFHSVVTITNLDFLLEIIDKLPRN